MRLLHPIPMTLVLLFTACSSAPENAGMSCTTPAQCYPNADARRISGTVTCLTQYSGGYCTHTCQTDANCCAVPGECLTGFKEVCSPFENQPTMYCFLSCESADIQAAPNGGAIDPNAFCQRWGGPSLTCRSTGGGSANRHFCG